MPPLDRRTNARTGSTPSKNRPFWDDIPGANLSQNSRLNSRTMKITFWDQNNGRIYFWSGSKKNWDRKNFGREFFLVTEKILDRKKIWDEKFFWPKIFWSTFFFGSNNFLDRTIFWIEKKILEKKSDGQYAVTFYLLGVGWRQTTWEKLLLTPDNTDRFLRVCEHSILRCRYT